MNHWTDLFLPHPLIHLLNAIHRTLSSLLLVGSAITSSLSAMDESSDFPLSSHASGPVKIVCFGDSVTGLYYHTGGRRTYTNLLGSTLQRSLPQAEIEMHNAGVSGNTTADALDRIESDVLYHHPDLVTIMFGLNDMVRVPLPEFRTNLINIIRQCREAGARVILSTPNATTDNPTRPTALLLDYCDTIRSVAAEYQVTLSDNYESFTQFRAQDELGWRLMMSDEIHPNLAGHRFIAEQLASTILGRPISIAPLSPSAPAIPRTAAAVNASRPLRILAMPPFDLWIEASLNSATAKITTWEIADMNLTEIEADAKTRVRPLEPDLVVIAVPRSAKADSLESTIHAHAWIANWSQHFAKRKWDCIIVHPDVLDPDGANSDENDLIRQLATAVDLPLVDRKPGDRRPAQDLFTTWVRDHLVE